jgi:hypothetical protein
MESMMDGTMVDYESSSFSVDFTHGSVPPFVAVETLGVESRPGTYTRDLKIARSEIITIMGQLSGLACPLSAVKIQVGPKMINRLLRTRAVVCTY